MTLRAYARSLVPAVVLGGIVAACAASTPTPADRMGSVREIASLDDPNFAPSNVRAGRKTPIAFQRDDGGLYILGGHAFDRVYVVFVHGINGSPRDFRFLIDSLDRRRFQPCAFYYASGAALDSVTEQLSSALAEFTARYRVRSVAIVAHSMGGLIARQLLVNELQPTDLAVPLFVTLSTPWEGHAGAALGARFAPSTPPSWHDIAIGSRYLADLFEAASGRPKRLPQRTQHHLLFSYRKSWIALGPSGDRVVSLASQLGESAQAQASRIYGFDVTHVGILKDPGVAALLSQLLDSTFGPAPAEFVLESAGASRKASTARAR